MAQSQGVTRYCKLYSVETTLVLLIEGEKKVGGRSRLCNKTQLTEPH